MDIPGTVNMDYEIIEEEIGDRERMSTLTIVNSEPSDAGQYACVAMNNVTYTLELARLTVHGRSLTTN